MAWHRNGARMARKHTKRPMERVLIFRKPRMCQFITLPDPVLASESSSSSSSDSDGASEFKWDGDADEDWTPSLVSPPRHSDDEANDEDGAGARVCKLLLLFKFDFF